MDRRWSGCESRLLSNQALCWHQREEMDEEAVNQRKETQLLVEWFRNSVKIMQQGQCGDHSTYISYFQEPFIVQSFLHQTLLFTPHSPIMVSSLPIYTPVNVIIPVLSRPQTNLSSYQHLFDPLSQVLRAYMGERREQLWGVTNSTHGSFGVFGEDLVHCSRVSGHCPGTSAPLNWALREGAAALFICNYWILWLEFLVLALFYSVYILYFAAPCEFNCSLGNKLSF